MPDLEQLLRIQQSVDHTPYRVVVTEDVRNDVLYLQSINVQPIYFRDVEFCFHKYCTHFIHLLTHVPLQGKDAQELLQEHLEIVWHLFRFLQLLCEGHNSEFQDFLRTQVWFCMVWYVP